MKFTEKIIAPVKVLAREKTYVFWLIFVSIFGLINIWSGLLMGKFAIVYSMGDFCKLEIFS